MANSILESKVKLVCFSFLIFFLFFIFHYSFFIFRYSISLFVFHLKVFRFSLFIFVFPFLFFTLRFSLFDIQIWAKYLDSELLIDPLPLQVEFVHYDFLKLHYI